MDNQFNERNGLQEIIDKALEDMRRENGGEIDLSKINLADFSRRTGLTRSRARTLKEKGFRVGPHGRCGKKADSTVMSGHEHVVDGMLAKGVTNSSVIYDRLVEDGYEGGLTTAKAYIAAHLSLVPAKRRTVEPQGSRGQRFQTGPGEAYQMDWGFVDVRDPQGNALRFACFAMVCHHCGTCYVEFFPNARQENLFIGMIHAFAVMGVPLYVLTDNMKSVTIRRDADGRPVWQADYAAFMECIGFKTKLRKPRHPFTKGKVERLVRHVKDNFAAGRTFRDVTQLNSEALEWCARKGSQYRRALGIVPAEVHLGECAPACRDLELSHEATLYLCPPRKVSFDGFVCYEGRRFGVPYWHSGRTCRVSREGEVLHIYDEDLSLELASHAVTWGRRDSFCEDQYADAQPAELPTAPVTVTMSQIDPPSSKPGFERFDFEGRLR